MRRALTITVEEMEALETLGVRFGFRVFEPAACVPSRPGPWLGSLGRMPRGVEFFATWPRRTRPSSARVLAGIRKVFVRSRRVRLAIARAFVGRMGVEGV